ncbi:MAG: histidine kinase [SAR86 cluster bacterium]|uniref:histidine kinase n=1 Tax=SAR86 cluster bacterium TaxID=2030880 RepID=A0A2A4X376_9GAMM|nr:MAG: histidine kinase [SAR86 cluster bacterium]
MAFNRFGLLLLVRFLLLTVGLYCFIYLFNHPRFHATTLFMFFILLALTWELWFFINKTNRELSRFFSAARYSDFGQQFNFSDAGGSFTDLGETFNTILGKLRQQKQKQEQQIRHMSAMIEHIPTPLLSVLQDGSILLRNNAARQLFGSISILNIADLRQFGDDFCNKIASSKAGKKQMSKFSIDDIESDVMISSIKFTTGKDTESLVSLQDIGNELETTQLKAWEDLARVLTHEIMNSITPVASLSQTIVDMVDDADQKALKPEQYRQSLDEIGEAAVTVARRSNNLVKFVSNYRKLTKLPSPKKSKLDLQELFEHVIRLMDADSSEHTVKLVSNISPSSLNVYADREMIEQTLINLVRNSKQALTERKEGEVILSAYLNSRGNVIIEVSDNGTGIEEKLLRKIFVPYFTTKSDGSGIGLALARQFMISHGGSIGAANNSTGGSKFILSF